MPAPGKSKKKSIEKNQTPIRNFFKPVSKDDKQEKLKTIPFDESGLDVKEDLREDEKENGGANRDDRYVDIFRKGCSNNLRMSKLSKIKLTQIRLTLSFFTYKLTQPRLISFAEA